MNNEPVRVASPTEFSLGHLVQIKEEVDALLKRAEAAGATATGEPYERPWGIYSGYFKDVDGHLWEIIQHLSNFVFTWQGSLPGDHTYPGPGGVLVTSPNNLLSQMVFPAGKCS